MSDAPLERTAAYVRDQTADGMLMTAAQVCAIGTDGRTRSIACGRAAVDVGTETMFRVYCAGKPFTAVAVAKLVDSGAVALDEPLSRLLPEVRALRRPITLREVLAHRAGLQQPTGVQMELLPVARRSQVLFDETDAAEPTGEGTTAYSEVLAWSILGRLVEAVSGEPVHEHLRRSLLEPLGLHDTYFGMSGVEYAANVDRIGINYDMRSPPKVYAVLMERREDVCREVNCAYGCYTTANDLARFYKELLEQLSSGGNGALPAPATLREFCAPNDVGYDVVFGRRCAFGLGFMHELETHNFGRYCSPHAFGHTGWSGSSFGFGDPVTGVAVAAITNGLLTDAPARLSRLTLLRALTDDGVLVPSSR